MVTIRLYDDDDWLALWSIIEPVFRAGKTYVFSPQITEDEAHHVWVDAPSATFVATDERDGKILGTYYIKPNQTGLGDHVCNCGYIVSEGARGRGIASLMCEHSQAEAVSRKFLSMQYNLVVSTNEDAIRLWKKHGFDVVGTLPQAFRDPDLGYVDAFVMHKMLGTEQGS
ncbi:MAG: GNAT family N-acetyltransferase [Verrucomicrobia bacterium]|nr:GNAT family N-acetyltransferase [Verrucomicrobiota bacterium]